MENNRMIKALAVITPVAATTAYYLFKNREIPEPSGEAYQELPKLPYEKNPNKHIITKTPKTIGIIGAGISGLIGAKILKAQGYDVEVIEKNSGPGGVWYECYDGSGLQGDKYSYNLPDYQFSDSDPLYPKQPLIKAWIEKMLDEFDIRKLIRFNTEVVTITQNQDETWKVVFKEGGFKDYDFLIISTGICTRPNLPNINGIENFNGTVIHSSEFINAKKLCDGKKVIVVGGGKSAFDVMNASVDYGGTVTGVVKKIGHSFPFDSKPLGIPLGFTLCSRFY